MKPIFQRCILACALLAAHAAALAGSPGGLLVLVVPSASAQAHLAPVKAYLDRYGPDESKNCGNSMLSIDQVRFAGARDKIQPDLAIAATVDAKQRRRLARALTSYRDKAYPRGFDAALVFDAKGGQLQLFGISGDGGAKPYKGILPVAALGTPARLHNAMCRALGELPVLEAP